MATEIRLTISGENVSPATVPLPDLLALLREFYAAVAASAQAVGMNRDEVRINLTSVREGSNIVVLNVDEPTQRQARRVVSAISTDDALDLPQRSRKAIHKMWSRMNVRHWSLNIASISNGDTATATLTPEIEPFRTSTAKGTTSLLVYISRAGGEHPTANIRLPDKRDLTARVRSKTINEQLGCHLYHWVEVFGEAQWNIKTWAIDRLRIDGLGPYVHGSSDPIAALTKLAELSSHFWDAVDPQEYIREQRSDD